MIEHIQTQQEDVFLNDEFNEVKLRSDLLPWGYNLAALITVIGAFCFNVSILLAWSNFGEQITQLTANRPLLYFMISCFITSSWLITGIILGWCSIKYALMHIYIPGGMLLLMFLSAMVVAFYKASYWNGGVLILVVAVLSVITIQAFVIRKPWKVSLRKKPQ